LNLKIVPPVREIVPRLAHIGDKQMESEEKTASPKRPLDEDQAAALVDSLIWTYAKTMSFAPHWYVVRDRDLDSDRFEALVRYIHGHGRPGRWGSLPRSTVLGDGRIIEGLIYCDIGDHRYWTMGWPVVEETIINREEVTASTVCFIDVTDLDHRPELTDS
jgi:hypothetical protein